MSLRSYEGMELGMRGEWHITISLIRPAACRYEASTRDGYPSLFGATLSALYEEIDEAEAEWEEDAGVSLSDWLDAWEQAVADGQSSISRTEALSRWERESAR